jgi:solute carrier family 30 (zinc transporter), member 2
MLPKTGKTY